MFSEWSTRPTMRTGNADREYAMAQLRAASAAGHLGAEEFDRRLRLAMRAQTFGELAGLVADLPGQQLPPPQPYVYAPARKRNDAGVIVAIIAACVVAAFGLATAGFFALDSITMSDEPMDEGLRTEPGACAGPPEEAFPMDCLPDDNPLAWADLSTSRVDQLERLGLPRTLPIIADAEFDDRAWQAAATSRADEPSATTYTWHLEYLVGDVDGEGPTQPEHVLALYRATVDPGRFGADPQEVKGQDGAIGLEWSGVGQENELMVWVRTEPTGEERVELDVQTHVQPAVERPDVLGAPAEDVKRQKVATVPGMIYLRSKVSQYTGQQDTCLVVQVWSATPANHTAVKGKVGEGVTATYTDGELTFASTTRCTAFNL